MFCDTDLASRIERAECELLTALHARVAVRRHDTFSMPIGGGLAVFAAAGSPLNKVAGLGFAPFDDGAWAAIEAEHDRRSAELRVEIATLADPTIARRLTARGHELVAVENVLGRTLLANGAMPALPSGITVERSPDRDLESWLVATVTGFAQPDTQGVPSGESFDRSALEAAIRGVAEAPGFVRFVARRDGELAGTATVRVSGDVAQLCGATTLPAHRRRGVQSALLATRLAFAARSGATLAVVTTEPGSKSQQNTMKNGFALLYARNVLVRSPRTAVGD